MGFCVKNMDAPGVGLQVQGAACFLGKGNALAVKLLVMVLGLLGYASMWAAVFADSGVAMLCVLNAIRLLYRKK